MASQQMTEAASYLAEVEAAGRVLVWDEDRQEHADVTPAEAAHGMLRYARRLRPGSAERGEVERQALAMLPPVRRSRRPAQHAATAAGEGNR
jgi:hypothetical protein